MPIIIIFNTAIKVGLKFRLDGGGGDVEVFDWRGQEHAIKNCAKCD